MLVFYKNWKGIGESPVRNEFHREASAACLQQRQMITFFRYSFPRYRSQNDTINNIPSHSHTILSASIFWSRYNIY